MQMLAVPLQTETRPDEGLALTWFEVPGAIRYGLIIGVPGASMPELDVIMRGQTQQFAIVGVPSRFTGAVDIGTPPGETRQFGMVAYRNDGEILAVPSLQIHPARSAPRDREYHAVVPPALVDPNPPAPSSQHGDPNDPWSALEATSAPGHGSGSSFVAPAPSAAAPSFTVPSPVSTPSTPHAPAPYDPWDVLSQPATPEPAPPPPSNPTPAPAARYEAEAAQFPVEPALRYEPPASEYPVEPRIQAEPTPRFEPSAAEIPAEPPPTLEAPTIVSPAERTSEAGPPITAVPDEVDVTSAWAEPIAAVGTSVSVPSEPAWEERSASWVASALAAGEESTRQGAPPAEAEPGSMGLGAAGEGTTLAGRDVEESPAAVVTPRATWERGFAEPPEIKTPAAQDEPEPPIIIDPLFHAAPSAPVAPPVPAAPPPAPAPPLSAGLAAVLDEAELYLLPQWADHDAALRLLEQAEREAPEHPRVRDLRARLEAAQGGGDNSAQLAALLEEADRSLKEQDYWAAVDHYERILSEEPAHEGALAGIAQARLRARWPTRLAGASGDAAALQSLGDEAATEAPDLAGQAYAAAFAIQPAVDVLRGWLIAFVHAGHGGVLPGTARRAVKVLEDRGKILAVPAVAQALDGLDQAAAGDAAGAESAVNQLCDTLVSAMP